MMSWMSKTLAVAAVVAGGVSLLHCSDDTDGARNNDGNGNTTGAGAGGVGGSSGTGVTDPLLIESNARLERGRQIFRFDTFGSEVFWGDTIHLNQAIAGEANGGVGPGVSPNAALALGLKVDMDAIPADVAAAVQAGQVNLDDPATTVALIKLNAVVGITGIFDDAGTLSSMGIQCALCHSTVDDAFAPGVGHRLDGWPNRDLNVGAIVASAPDLSAFANLLEVDIPTVITVLNSWGPGKFDAELAFDGKAFRPDGGTAATLIPPAFGQSGVNLHTYTGWGSTTHWNALVSTLEMHGQGTFYDPRLNDMEKFPIAAKNNMGNLRPAVDMTTPKLGDLHFYQLALSPPKAPAASYDAAAAERGQELFVGKAKCGTCHVPPLYTEPGWNMHTPEEIGIDDFQAMRSPDEHYRTTPLGGWVAKQKGGFYHDGRFPTLLDVINHYDTFMTLGLTEAEKADLAEFVKSI
ncbi:MAG: hypothetical protein HOV80_29615 [Polyangiaceae bacterium]|nr:hypothetical protein [Polyangiaceae bacterium]